MCERGATISLEEIERDIARRDSRDMNRADAPLRPASDALTLDTTAFSRDQAIETAIEIVRKKRNLD